MSIFCKIGVSPYTTSVVAGIVYFLTTILAMILVDKVGGTLLPVMLDIIFHALTCMQIGRKALLLLGALGMMFSMLVAATLVLEFTLEEGENKEVGYVVVTAICVFVFSYAGTFG